MVLITSTIIDHSHHQNYFLGVSYAYKHCKCYHLLEPISLLIAFQPINANSGQNQPDNFDGILQAKAKLVKY